MRHRKREERKRRGERESARSGEGERPTAPEMKELGGCCVLVGFSIDLIPSPEWGDKKGKAARFLMEIYTGIHEFSVTTRSETVEGYGGV